MTRMNAAVLGKSGYDVLNVVALKKMAGIEVIAAACLLDAGEVGGVLDLLAARGLVVVVAGSVLPTDAAEPALAAAAATHYAGLRADPGIGAQVERFESVNAQFLTAMSAWQQIDAGGRKVANDHTDSGYDDKVVARLHKLAARLDPLLSGLAGHDPRFAVYRRRFTAAFDAIDAGRHELVSAPTVDSVHNIWFEFHEDLLRTLGRERTE